jgi:hypothetical protein
MREVEIDAEEATMAVLSDALADRRLRRERK